MYNGILLSHQKWKKAIFSNMDGTRDCHQGFPGGSVSEERIHLQCRKYRRHGFSLQVGKTPWRRKWQPTPIFLPGESYDRGTWQACIHGITNRWIWLKWLSSHRNCHTEWSKSDREGEILYDIHYMHNLKRHDTNELIYITEIVSQTWRTNLWLPGGRIGGRDS